MKKSLIVAIAALFTACSGGSTTAPSADSAKVVKDSGMAMRPINSPYRVIYSANFTMDDPKYAEAVLALWKAYDSGNIASTKDLIADSIELYLSDGSSSKISRDSAVGMVKEELSSVRSVKSAVNAVMSVKSDKGEHWGLIWGSHTYVEKKGNSVTEQLQETWRFNDAGKATLLYEFSQEQPKKKGK
jgi:hypothetical protein